MTTASSSPVCPTAPASASPLALTRGRQGCGCEPFAWVPAQRHTVSSVSPRALVIADETPSVASGAPARSGRCTSAIPTRTASSTSPRRSSCSSPPSCPRRPRTSGSTRSRRSLFAKYRTAADYAAADRAELEAIIQPTGFFRAKTNSLIKLGQALVERFGGEVPAAAGRPGHAARRRPQDRERRAGQRLRHPGHHRRHALRPAGPPVRLDRRGATRSRSSTRSASCSRSGLDDALPPGDLPRPPHLPRRKPACGACPVARCARRTGPARPTRSGPRNCSSSSWPRSEDPRVAPPVSGMRVVHGRVGLDRARAPSGAGAVPSP